MKRYLASIFQKWRRSSVLPIAVFLSVSVAAIAHIQVGELNASQHLTNLETKNFVEENKRLQQQLLILKKSPSFGFDNLVADGIFLNFLQYFSDVQADLEIENDLSSKFFDAIIALDPFYRDYYLFLAGSSTLYAGEPEITVELMGKGLSNMDSKNAPSDAFYIWRYKAVEELLFIGDGQAAQDSFEYAAEWAAHSNHPDSDLMERLSSQTAEFLRRDPDSLFAQIAAWNSIVANALNEDIREKASQRVQELTDALQNQASRQSQLDSEGEQNVAIEDIGKD